MMRFKLISNPHHKNEAVKFKRYSCSPSYLEVKINVMLFSLAGKKVVWVHAVLKAMEITGVLLTRSE